MAIITGRINTDELGFTEAMFSDGLKTTTDYPDGYEFVLSSLTFSKDEESGEIVFSPNADTRIEVVTKSGESEGDCFLHCEESQTKLGVSIFALVDLLWEKQPDAINDLVYNTLISRNYTVRK